MEKYLLIIFLSLVLLITYLPSCQAVNLDTKLMTEYNYHHFDQPPLTNNLTSDSSIEVDLTGFYDKFEYQLELIGRANDYNLELSQANISTIVDSTVLEAGKKEWVWGTGFSFSPTYTLDNQINYWGLEAKTIFTTGTLSYGSVLTENNDQLYSSWLRYNSLLATSDYTLVLSYLDEQSKPENINLGFNYSKDFLTGLEVHGASNLIYQDLTNQTSFQHLLGLEYITPQNKMILLEYYQQDDNKLTLAINNHSSTFSDWNWQLKETINLDDQGQLSTFDLSYTQVENITPKLEISNFSGPNDSKLEQNPTDWIISLKVTVNL